MATSGSDDKRTEPITKQVLRNAEAEDRRRISRSALKATGHALKVTGREVSYGLASVGFFTAKAADNVVTEVAGFIGEFVPVFGRPVAALIGLSQSLVKGTLKIPFRLAGGIATLSGHREAFDRAGRKVTHPFMPNPSAGPNAREQARSEARNANLDQREAAVKARENRVHQREQTFTREAGPDPSRPTSSRPAPSRAASGRPAPASKATERPTPSTGQIYTTAYIWGDVAHAANTDRRTAEQLRTKARETYKQMHVDLMARDKVDPVQANKILKALLGSDLTDSINSKGPHQKSEQYADMFQAIEKLGQQIRLHGVQGLDARGAASVAIIRNSIDTNSAVAVTHDLATLLSEHALEGDAATSLSQSTDAMRELATDIERTRAMAASEGADRAVKVASRTSGRAAREPVTEVVL